MEGCRPGKHPYGRFVPHGAKDATSDTDIIRRWFNGAGVNVGVSIDGFVVLDIDKRHGGLETLAECKQKHGALPITPTVKSGGGGLHYYFKPLSMSLKQKVQVGVGVELLTSGGLIAPPSLHKDGAHYEWTVPLETPRAELPTWLVEIIAECSLPLRGSEVTPPDAFNPMKGVVLAGQSFTELGRLNARERNEAVNRVIGSMLGYGFTPEQIEADGLRWAERQEPPYSADDLREKVRWCSAKSCVEIEALPVQPLSKGVTTVRCSPVADAGEDDTTPNPVEQFDAYYGVLGEFVRAVEPHTEADPHGILACLLCGVGNALGRSIHHQIGRRHSTNLFVLLTGETTDRKGTCWDIAEALLTLACPQWADNCIENGFGSGQGLAWRIRDANGNDEGVVDKRLLVVEEEFGKPLKLAKSENSILSAMVRSAFDSKALGVMNKGENRYGCRDPHISIVGMITPTELLKLVTGMTAVEDGFLNRFLLCGVNRKRYLQQGSDWRSVAMRFASVLQDAMAKASSIDKPFVLNEGIAGLWEKEYRRLEERRPGDYGSVVARLSVHTLKVAMVYAALDGSPLIQEPHLRASLSLIAHSDRTAMEVFGGVAGTPHADDKTPE